MERDTMLLSILCKITFSHWQQLKLEFLVLFSRAPF